VQKVWAMLFACLFVFTLLGCEKQVATNENTWVELGNSIDGTNWEDTVGYQRLEVIIQGILQDWSDKQIKFNGSDIQVEQDAQIFGMLVVKLYQDPSFRRNNLNEMMTYIKNNMSQQGSALLSQSPVPTQSVKQSSPQPSSQVTANVESALTDQLEKAITSNQAEQVKKLLIQGANPNAIGDYSGLPLLTYAASKGRAAIVKVLLDAGADPSSNDQFGSTPILSAVQLFGTDSVPDDMKTPDEVASVIDLLLKAGSDPNSTYEGEGGLSVLMDAASGKYAKAVQLLLRSGANPNQKDSSGETALFYTLSDSAIFQTLLDAGADPAIINEDGETVIDTAKKYYKADILKLLGISFKLRSVNPYNEEVEKIRSSLKAGMTKQELNSVLGSEYMEGMSQGIDEDYAVIRYDFPGISNVSFDKTNIGNINVEDFKNGKKQMQIMFYPEGELLNKCTVYIMHEDGKVYHYDFKPGETNIIGYAFN
jgi:ankyrin repeat protein